jgi:hypothetical protein
MRIGLTEVHGLNKVSKVRIVLTLLLGTSLWGSAALGAAEVDAEEGQAVRILAPLVEDSKTGYGLYRLLATGDPAYESRLLLRDPDDKWSALHERFGGIMPFDNSHGDGARDPEYKVWIKDRPGWYTEQQYYYNLEDQAVYEGLSYIWSPNRRAGYSLVSTPRPLEAGVPFHDWLERSLLVKDGETGDIHEWMRFDTGRFQLYWLDDTRLFISHYNTKAKQNELLILSVQNGERTHFAYGTAYAHDATSGEILFVRNEPSRTRFIYELRTGHVRKATDDEIRRLTPEPLAALEEVSTELDWRTLPIADPPIIARHEHRIIVDGVSIDLPHAFRREGTLYIPVRPLLTGLGLQLEGKSGSAARYRIPIKSGSTRVVLQPNQNSLVLAGRVYTTQGVLQSLGFKNIRVEANASGREL